MNMANTDNLEIKKTQSRNERKSPLQRQKEAMEAAVNEIEELMKLETAPTELGRWYNQEKIEECLSSRQREKSSKEEFKKSSQDKIEKCLKSHKVEKCLKTRLSEKSNKEELKKSSQKKIEKCLKSHQVEKCLKTRQREKSSKEELKKSSQEKIEKCLKSQKVEKCLKTRQSEKSNRDKMKKSSQETIEKCLKSHKIEKCLKSRRSEKSSREKTKRSSQEKIEKCLRSRRSEKAERTSRRNVKSTRSSRRASLPAGPLVYEDDEQKMADIPQAVYAAAISQFEIAARFLYRDRTHVVRHDSIDCEHKEAFAWEEEEKEEQKQPNDVHYQEPLSSRLVSGLVSSLGKDEALRRGSEFISNSVSLFRSNLQQDSENIRAYRVIRRRGSV